MKLDLANFQTVAANVTVGGDVCDVTPLQPPTQTEIDTDIAPLIHRLAATPIAEIDQLISEFQEAKSYLQSECERLEQETVRYANLTHLASETAEIIFNAMSQWHPARSQEQSTASEVTAASTEDDIGAISKSNKQSHRRKGSKLGQPADDTEGT
jgi:hypothetical protein